ncbi:MAG: SelB C-terminal domain-containing protein [Nitriliruptoraceae bacterium]
MDVLATAGHVDHGKSALVRALTGREPDRFAEELRRGLTIDLGFVWTTLSKGDAQRTVAFVDVPGHDRFLTNMLAGVGPVSDVLLVVAADDGWSAQSEEHLEIVTLLRRRIVAAVVTKTTPAGPTRTAEVLEDVHARLAAAGASATPVVAVDALDGSGLDALRDALLARLTAPRTDDQAPAVDARLWIDRVFSVAGAGTVVTGTLSSGRLERGDRVSTLPGGQRGRIRELRSLEVSVDEVTAPARVAVALAGVDADQVERGDALVGLRRDGTPTALATHSLDVWLEVLPHAAVGHRGAWQLHLGTARRDARILPLLGELQPGDEGPVRIELEVPVTARVGDRIVLREIGQRITVAGGTVLDVEPSRRRRGQTERLLHAEALDAVRSAAGPAETVAAVLAARGGSAPLTRLEAAVGHPLGEVLDAGDGLRELGGQVVERERFDGWVTLVAAAAQQPSDPSGIVSRDEVLAAARADGCPEELAAGVLRSAVEAGLLTDVGGRVVHRDHVAAYEASRQRRQQALLDALLRDPPTFITLEQAAAEHDVPRFEVQMLLEDGRLLAHGDLLFTPDTLHRAVRVLDAGPAADGAAFTASEARQAWGLPRRHAVPLLEYLRATGHTTFDGAEHRRTRAPQ